MGTRLVPWVANAVSDPRALALSVEDGLVEGAIVLLASDVVASERQVSAAAFAAQRRWERGTAVARSLAAEFMRCLAGSHHVGEAIRAVGLTAGAERGWLVAISVASNEVDQRMNANGLQPASQHAMTPEGRARLGIPTEGDAEVLALGRIAESDLLA